MQIIATACVSLTPVTAALAQGTEDSRPADPAGPVVESLRSADGTEIVYERSGTGPALILVSSALSDRRGNAPLAVLLAPHFTVVSYDRRGRGESGDAARYAVRREVEDLEALVDRCGGSAFLFGSSSGAVLALEAADALGDKVRAQVLFEPPFVVDDSRPAIPEDAFRRIEALLADGRRDAAVEVFMEEVVGVPAAMVEGMRRSSMWKTMERLAHTLPYDGTLLEGLQSGRPLPAGRWRSVTARTLVIDGERSDPFLRNAVAALADALPVARRATLEGHDHSAPFVAPEALVPLLVEFLEPDAPAR